MRVLLILCALLPSCRWVTKQPATGPSPAKVRQYMRDHNGSAPPADWYPNGDPWRGLTTEELEAMEPDEGMLGVGG